ncbi:MAG TPA: SURF1 family cytochrome oxidase biogenesis protein [Aestuariivirga sp.]
MRKGAGPVLICAALGIAFLCGLGVWQVKRLAWKTSLIAQLEARMSASPVPLNYALNRMAAGEDIEYVKVSLVGEMDSQHTLFKQVPYNNSAGWEAIAPFSTDAGVSVLVDLGASDNCNHFPKSVALITGVIRLHNKGRGYFDAKNNVEKNTWFWWDLPAMKKAAQLIEPAAPVIVQAFANDSGFEASKPEIELSNNHLGYAITWFGLAAALAGVAGAFVFGRERR